MRFFFGSDFSCLMVMASSLACLLILLSPIAALSLQTPFVYHGFQDSDLDLSGASVTSGLLMLTNSTQYAIGRAFYGRAIQMFDKSPERKLYNFSTSFVFAIVPSSVGSSGYGLAFVLAPSTQFPGALSGHYFGLFNSSNNGSNHIFVVEFDTVRGQIENTSTEGNHVGINLNGLNSTKFKAASYFDGSNDPELTLDSGELIRAWIEFGYDGPNQVVNVTVAPANLGKPTKPLMSLRNPSANLSSVLKEQMFVGFSASTGEKTSFHYISGWSFAVNEPAPFLSVSKLPKPPKVEPSSPSPSKPFSKLVTALIAALSTVTFLGILILAAIYRRRLNSESLEEWEIDCPHRFNYNDLYKATKGFKDTQLVGSGGFGSVYKGFLPSTGCEVAVKKVTRNSSQGMKEFAAEIESLGRLSHKNLVNLQGWCKKKTDLLIVYDFIPNGSLYSLLYHPKDNFFLNWEQRFNILKGIAAGIVYLHEEWEQVVIHRDVKPSNVLIDSDMNARLSDFGLARQYDHSQLSHTTNVVGTFGYISPELARTGKASKTTDVFAYGVVLLEVACGRKPIESEQFILVDWVMECHERGKILEAADPKLNEVYEMGEMEIVLQLGLLCSHQKPEARPTMKQVTRYLNGEDQILPIDPSNYSQVISHSSSGFSQFVSTNLSSSTGLISTTSIDTGR